MLDALRMLGLAPLGLRVERMLTAADFSSVAELRRRAYGRHYPRFVQTDTPDAWDCAPSTVVLMVRPEPDAPLVGTMRIRHSFAGRQAGELELDAFPDALFAQGKFITIERFCIDAAPARRTLVRLLLFSTALRLARGWGADSIALYTREELEPLYAQLGFERGGRVLCSALTNHVPQHFMSVAVEQILERTTVPFAPRLVSALTRQLDLDVLLPSNLGGPAFRFAPAGPSPAVEYGRLHENH